MKKLMLVMMLVFSVVATQVVIAQENTDTSKVTAKVKKEKKAKKEKKEKKEKKMKKSSKKAKKAQAAPETAKEATK